MKAGATVYGVSPDKPSAQKKFQEKYDLPYSLLADVDKDLAKKFDVLKEKSMYGRKYMGIERTTFVIDPKGKIAAILTGIKPDEHAKAVLAALEILAMAILNYAVARKSGMPENKKPDWRTSVRLSVLAELALRVPPCPLWLACFRSAFICVKVSLFRSRRLVFPITRSPDNGFSKLPCG